MERVPILKIGQTLFVSIQIDLQDQSVVQRPEDLADELVATWVTGVIIDITAVEIVDSFIGRMLATIGSISRLFDAETVLVGMRPATPSPWSSSACPSDGCAPRSTPTRACACSTGIPKWQLRVDELPITSGDDVVRVRQHVRAAAADTGLSLVDQTKLVTAASELARNPWFTRAAEKRGWRWPSQTPAGRASGSPSPMRDPASRTWTWR